MEGTTQKTSTSAIKDLQSPYYLHHTNHHGSIVITPKLNSSNYVAWSRSFILALSIRNKTRFIDGTIPKAATIDSLFEPWVGCNNLILARLLESLTPRIASTMFYMNSTTEVWNTLKLNFDQPDDTRVCNLQYSLGNVSQGSRSVVSYFIELKGI